MRALAIGLAGALWAGLRSRSLTGDLEPADREALRRSVQAVRQDRRREILVRFDDS